MTPLDTNRNVVIMDKLACITKVAFSLDKIDKTDNLEDGNLSNVLLRHHATANEEFTSFESLTPQYKAGAKSYSRLEVQLQHPLEICLLIFSIVFLSTELFISFKNGIFWCKIGENAIFGFHGQKS